METAFFFFSFFFHAHTSPTPLPSFSEALLSVPIIGEHASIRTKAQNI